MRLLSIWGLGTMLSLMLTMSARADPARATVADVQCLVVGARLASSSDWRERQRGSIMAIYFLGRIDGRSPHVDLQMLLKREAKKMTVAELKRAARRCNVELSARGAEIAQIGKTLEQLGK